MATTVYANGSAIACKAGDGKVVAAFPDVCMSPPPPPAGPVPIPYPNSSFSRDMKDGSRTTKIGGQPVMLRDQSFYKSSPLGNEAATRNFGGSVLSHTITGKTYFAAWSMDVTFEGKNVPRHLDLATSNHSSYPGSTPPYPEMEAMTAVALDRIAKLQCPCCGKSAGEEGCPAAFKEGETPQSMEDFYGLNTKSPDGALTAEAADRMKVYKTMLGMKAKNCTCNGRVFPQAPCDVFRPPNSARTAKTEKKWGESNYEYFTEFMKKNPTASKDFVAANPKAPAPSNGPSFSKTDHLTPKGAGGCPDNPGNLQPHDLLCSTCKMIDDQFGRWQGAKTWKDAWNAAFRSSGIKRFRVADFIPGWW